jgi:hypothetical protein
VILICLGCGWGSGVREGNGGEGVDESCNKLYDANNEVHRREDGSLEMLSTESYLHRRVE